MNKPTDVIPYVNLTHFQQWCMHYIISKKSIHPIVEDNIDNLCDTTKNNIDLNNFDKSIEESQIELDEIIGMGLFNSISSDRYITLNAKGKLYIHQHIEQNLSKIKSHSKNNENILNDNKFKNILDILNGINFDFLKFAQFIVSNPSMAMTYIMKFEEIIKLI